MFPFTTDFISLSFQKPFLANSGFSASRLPVSGGENLALAVRGRGGGGPGGPLRWQPSSSPSPPHGPQALNADEAVFSSWLGRAATGMSRGLKMVAKERALGPEITNLFRVKWKGITGVCCVST